MKVGQTVYADVLFLINFSMDFLVLYICARLAGRRLYPFRSALASAIGGAYGVASLFIDVNGFVTSIFDVAALLVICLVAFASNNMRLRDFFGRCILFALISAVLGGIMTALSSMLERSGLASLEYDSGDDISVWLFTIIAAAGGAAAFVGGKRMKRIAAAKSVDVEIKMNGKDIVLRAMTDTGNMLTDPLSGRAVALCELKAIEKLFSAEMTDYLRNGEFSARICPEIVSKIRFIPARGALAGKTTLLAAFEPDLFTVINAGGRVEADILVAPVPYNLSAGESRVLLPPGFVE
jgi:stage II sporulation protein GA (sporulation sigma-E factor processing peptidase)